MKKKILVIVVIFIISCDQKPTLENFICNNKIEYWNYEWPRKRAEFYGFTFSFNKDGTVTKYSYSKIKKTRRKFTDYEYPMTKWNVSNDSILTLFNSSLKIEKISKDTISGIDLGNKQFFKLIRVKGKLNIVE